MGKERINPEEIFNKAVEIDNPEERKAYLDKVCGDNKKLRADVEALLKADEKAGDFLEIPAFGEKVTLDDSAIIEGPGTMIGRYKLLELIGEGGMGLIYLAEQQEPIRRRVALKIVKLGMDTKQVIARFEAERQALAVLDHPNIAQVYDAGTTETGRPYFVMEYVKGIPITKYCDERKLNVEQRLRLFEDVCEGVHHAHQKGIIHRDLKPSNILITVHGDRAVAKIIDFGIAKAITQPLTNKTFVTYQGQLLGTPQYMSPEQVDMATQDIDTRSDIYSLGVVLYELLAGALPFDMESFEGAGFAQIQHTLRELEPASPSVRLTALGEEAKTIAASRGTQVVALSRRLHRELEWIPLKAMRKDRCRRYRSASEMADDVRNYLNGLPLIAGPETAIYRVKKFVHKHAGSVATVALIAAAIILGLVISTAMYFRAEEARKSESIARVRAKKAEQASKEKAENLRRALYCSHIALADEYYRSGDINGTRQLLELCPSDLRRGEWNRLDFVSRQSLMTMRGHTDLVHDVNLGATELIYGIALSPDGKRIASAGRDRTVRIWDLTTGANLMTLRGHEQDVGSVSFSPDGKRIVSASQDQTIRMWDADSGKELMTLRAHEGYVVAVFTPDGRHIVSASEDQTIKVWDAQTEEELMTLIGHEGPVTCVAVSLDEKHIVSGSEDKTIKLWDLETGDQLKTIGRHDDVVLSVGFNPDGMRIVSGSKDDTVKIWDLETGQELQTLQGHSSAVGAVAFSPDGKLVVSGSGDDTIRLWDSETGAEVKRFGEHELGVSSLVFHPDGKRLVSGSFDGTIKIWDLFAPVEVVTLGVHEDAAYIVIFSPDGRYIASSTKTTIKVYDVTSGREITHIEDNNNWNLSIAFSPDGSQIASCGYNPTVKIWNARTGVILHELRGHDENGAMSVAFSPDGKHLISGGVDATIRIWDTATGTELRTLRGHQTLVLYVAYSPDGKHIASGSGDNTIKIWNAIDGAEVMTLDVPESFGWWRMAFSPDGTRIVSGGIDKMIRIWDATSGRELHSWRAHRNIVVGISLSQDGERIASVCLDGKIKVWDMDSGMKLMTLADSEAASVAFSPDGKTIASGNKDGTIKLWYSASPLEGIAE